MVSLKGSLEANGYLVLRGWSVIRNRWAGGRAGRQADRYCTLSHMAVAGFLKVVRPLNARRRAPIAEGTSGGKAREGVRLPLVRGGLGDLPHENL